MSEISHLATDKDIVTIVTALIGAACLVIGGAIGFFTKYFYENKKINESKKALRQQMITNNIAPMRQEWINELRNKGAEYISNVDQIIGFEKYKHKYNKNSNEYKNDYLIHLDRILKTDILRTYIILMLPFKNDKKDEPLAEKLGETLSKINYFIGINNPTNEQIIEASSNLDKLVVDFKELLKFEWDKTKELKEIE